MVGLQSYFGTSDRNKIINRSSAEVSNRGITNKIPRVQKSTKIRISKERNLKWIFKFKLAGSSSVKWQQKTTKHDSVSIDNWTINWRFRLELLGQSNNNSQISVGCRLWKVRPADDGVPLKFRFRRHHEPHREPPRGEMLKMRFKSPTKWFSNVNF